MNTAYKWINAENNSKYTWDNSTDAIYGTFIYKNSNNEITKENINNIGAINECILTLDYLHINDCIGVCDFKLNLINYPTIKKIGWDSKNYCWVFFNNNSIKPSYYAKKI